MSKVWFTSDTHFGHVNIIEYCHRPFANVEDMDIGLIERWNKRVGKDDLVYHLGDFALGPKAHWMAYRAMLNGRLVIVAGNHDEPRQQLLRALRTGDEICDERTIVDAQSGQAVHLAHAPSAWAETRRGGQVVQRHGDDQNAALYLCGHVHGAWETKTINGKLNVNVGVDVWNYKPVSFEEIMRRVCDEPAKKQQNFFWGPETKH